MVRRVLQLLAVLCLIAQVGVAVAPPGAGICLRSVVAAITPAPGPAAICDCCRNEAPPGKNGLSGTDGHEEGCPAGCGCCITVPVVDRLNLVVTPPHQGEHVYLSPAVVFVPPPAMVADLSVWLVPPYWDPPPAFATPLRTIRLII